jgi:hypothetical protein
MILNSLNLELDDPKRIKDLNSFFALKCDIEEELPSCPWATSLMNPSLAKKNIYGAKINDIERFIGLINKSIYFKDNKKVLYDTIYFLELIDFLEHKRLLTYVYQTPDDIVNFIVPVLKETITIGIHKVHKIDDRLWLLVKEFVLNEFIPLPDLNEYVKNGYKTEEKRKIDKEVLDREHLLRTTRNSLYTTIAALIVSIIVNIITLCTINNERNISIIKDLTKNDTTKIKIMNNMIIDTAIKHDTVIIK